MRHKAFTTRPAAPADVEGIVRIQRAAVEKAWRPLIKNFDAFLAERFNHEAQVAKYHERLSDPARFIIVVAEKDRVVGFGGARKGLPDDQPPGFDYQGSAFYLDPAYLGSGASVVLLNGIMDELRTRGARSMSGWCLAENRVARNFYEKRGAKVVENIETPQDYAAVAAHVAYGWRLS